MESADREWIVKYNNLMGLLFGFSILIYLIVSYAPFLYPELNDLKYALPIVPFLLLLLIGKFKSFKPLTSYFLHNIILYLIIFFISFLVCFSRGIYARYFVEVFLVFCPLLFAFSISPFYVNENKKIFVRIAFLGTIGLYLLDKGYYLLNIFLHPKLLIDAIRTSSIETESGMAFVFGLFFLYYLMGRDKKNIWVSIIFCIISFKRISLAGLVICSVFWLLFQNKAIIIHKHRAVISFFLVVINLLVISILFQLISGKYDAFINQYIGLSTNQLLMGRYDLYKSIMSIIVDVPVFGIGFGKTVDILLVNNSILPNLHSDILKNFLEFGPILFILWLLSFYYFNSMNLKLLIIALYLNVLFLSDNVFIYFDVMFFFYFFTILFISEKRIDSKTRLLD